MKYVVDISEQRYRSLQECAVAVTDEIHKAVLNGKPYEERKKGRWIDVYKERFKGLHPRYLLVVYAIRVITGM